MPTDSVPARELPPISACNKHTWSMGFLGICSSGVLAAKCVCKPLLECVGQLAIRTPGRPGQAL